MTREQELTDLINDLDNKAGYGKHTNYGLPPATCGKGRVFLRIHPRDHHTIQNLWRGHGFQAVSMSPAMTLKKRAVQFVELTPLFNVATVDR